MVRLLALVVLLAEGTDSPPDRAQPVPEAATSEGPDCPETSADHAPDPVVEIRSDHAPTARPRVGREAPRLHPGPLEFRAPAPPRLLHPAPDAAGCLEPGNPDLSPGPVQWLLAPAELATFVPAGSVGRAPHTAWVGAEIGLRTAAHWRIVQVYADGAARVEVRGNAVAGSELPRARITQRHRVGVGASPTASLHFGLELSHQPGRGLDPLPEESRATASVRWRFGF
jgi:hypothetical protein